MKSKIVALVVAALLIAPAAVYALEFSAGLRFGSLEPDGDIESDGTKIELDDDLDIDGDSPVGMFVRVDTEKHHAVLQYAKISFDGDNVLTRRFQFDNQWYEIGADVDSKMEFSLIELTYYYDLWETDIVPGSKITLSPLAKLSIYGAGIDIEAAAPANLDESFSESLPLPTIGLICTYEFLEIAKVSGQINTISISGNSFTEYEFIAGVKPIEYLNLELGYKTSIMNFDESGDALDFSMSGLFGQVSYVYSF